MIPREVRRAEGPPSVARIINLSRGDRARIVWGSQISICLYTAISIKVVGSTQAYATRPKGSVGSCKSDLV